MTDPAMPRAPDPAPDDEPEAPAGPASPRQLAIHVGLFIAACVTTCLAGGVWFGVTLMTILTCHELGHYVAARVHKVDASLPYFIPLPPQISLGTLGAVIRMRRPIDDRGRLFDVGAAGPLAGLAVALPLLVIGLLRSDVGPPSPDSVIEGNSILYALIKYAVFGQWLPGTGAHGQVDVVLHPMAFAAWVGLLITMINLIPIGQLDGGHVARAMLGDRHETMSAWLHRLLPVMAVVTGGAMTTWAMRQGDDLGAALSYGSHGAVPWLMWSLMLLLMRRGSDGVYHPPVGGPPLRGARRWLALLVVVLFVLLFTPVPFRPVH